MDGDHALTSSWDTEVRAWDHPGGAVKKMFGHVQRVRAHSVPVTALARVAAGYVVTGDVDGRCKVFTTNDGEPLFAVDPPDEKPAPPEAEAGAPGEDEAASASAEPAVDTPEAEELKAAGEAKAALLAEYDGPWRCAGDFVVAPGAVVTAIAPLHQVSTRADTNDDDSSDAVTQPDVDARPERIAVALSSAGRLVHCVRVVDAAHGWAREQDLEHPEGVTTMIRRVCPDGKDRIVTGCLDGRVRVWAADPPPPPSEPETEGEAPEEGAGDDGEAAEPPPPPPPPPAFQLEATLDGHDKCAVSALAWLGDHPAFPPPRPPGASPDADEAAEVAAADDVASTYWPGCDSSLYFVSGGADGRVRMWARSRVPLSPEQLADGAVEPPPGEAAAYEWTAGDVITEAPISARMKTKDPAAAAAAAASDQPAVKSLLVAADSVCGGLSDGSVHVWGWRLRDGEGTEGWVLERIVPPANEEGTASPVTCLAACGHNLVVCTADGGMHLYA